MITSFKDLSLHPQILTTLDKLGISEPTDIQKKSIPVLLGAEKIDFWGQAQTGTGKTFAFGLPLIQNINLAQNTVQAIIIAPTRELVVQITQSLAQVGSPLGVKIEAIYGGVSMEKQIQALRRGVHIVVGTPGRVNDHLSRKILNLSNLKTLILDEADIMLDMGFKDEVDSILKAAPANRNIWLFSATVKSGISDIMHDHMKNTVKVSAAGQQVSTANTKQFYAIAPSRDRFDVLCRFVEINPDFYGFIFCQTKILTAEVADKLKRRGYKADALHGDMNQVLRNAIIKKFKNKEFNILVATDVAARGIDISDLTHVINYSLPQDHESYVHRIGRTGRAGKEGVAISFINKHELRYIQLFERKFKNPIKAMPIPTTTDINKVFLEKIKKTLDIQCNALNSQAENAELHDIIKEYNHEQLITYVKNSFASLFSCAQSISNDFAQSSDSDGNELQELMIPLGTDDNINEQDFSEVLYKDESIKPDMIEKLKVIKRRTFIKVLPDHVDAVMAALQGKTIQGKRVRVSISHDDGGSSFSRDRERSGGRRGRGGFGGGRDGGRRDGGGGFRRRR